MDAAFLESVASLRVPEMGTDTAAPLLYALVRVLRPSRVLEVGMGYTTPFLAKALEDNAADARRERADGAGPLALPDWYASDHEPQLICVDRMDTAASSASRAEGVLRSLGLADRCTIVEADLRVAVESVRGGGLIDFAWVDTWDTLAFLNGYWDLLDPAGGMLAIHWLLTYPEGRSVLRYLESLRAVDGGRLEIVNFREPNKAAQNSITIARRVRDYLDPDDLRARAEAQADPPPPSMPLVDVATIEPDALTGPGRRGG